VKGNNFLVSKMNMTRSILILVFICFIIIFGSFSFISIKSSIAQAELMTTNRAALLAVQIQDGLNNKSTNDESGSALIDIFPTIQSQLNEQEGAFLATPEGVIVDTYSKNSTLTDLNSNKNLKAMIIASRKSEAKGVFDFESGNNKKVYVAIQSIVVDSYSPVLFGLCVPRDEMRATY
jgi:regulatory protein YycI of two-component signal transduction system YycFG